MFNRNITYIVIAAFFLTGCTSTIPRWRQEARLVFDKVRLDGGVYLCAEEYRSVEEVILKGELYLANDELEKAEEYFHLARVKGEMLEHNIEIEKHKRKEAERLRIEAERQEIERQQAVLEEKQRLEKEKAEIEAQARIDAEKKKILAEKQKSFREKHLLSFYTVKRGESLPMIAAQQDVYNDLNLWPLLYRANRDQISDPRHIWPGQVLRIPRNLSREDYNEARRYAQEKSLH